MARKLIGTAVTDENGEATITYTGTGAGQLNIVAESGTFVSETCSILDCIYYDGGVTGESNPNWKIVSGDGTKTVDNTGTTLSNPNSETRYDIFANLGDISSVYDFQPPYIVEVDILEHTGTARFQIYDSTTRDVVNLINTTGHWKIEYDGTTVRPYKNGTALTTYARNMPNARIGFYIQSNEAIKYKNFMIYPI